MVAYSRAGAGGAPGLTSPRERSRPFGGAGPPIHTGAGGRSVAPSEEPVPLAGLEPGDEVVVKLRGGGELRGAYGGHDEVLLALDHGRRSVRIEEIADILVQAVSEGPE